MSSFQFLQRRREGSVEHLVLNRPEMRNAFNDRVVAEVTAWAAEVAQDSTVGAVVLSGAGRVFCAGGDLGWMAAMAAAPREDNLRDAAAAAAMFGAVNDLPVPVIARVHGAALGGGAGLAAVADIVVSEADAVFGFTEVKLGLLPGVIAPYVLAKIGESAARELFLTGHRFSATRAREMGLVHAVVAGDRLDATVQEYVEDVLSGGPEAVAAAKTLIRRLSQASGGEVTRLAVEAIATTRASPEAQARMRAFLRK